VFYRPAHAPDLNPDARLNSGLKGAWHSGLPATTKAELKRKARCHRHRLHPPERIRRYFQPPNITDAAAIRGFCFNCGGNNTQDLKSILKLITQGPDV